MLLDAFGRYIHENSVCIISTTAQDDRTRIGIIERINFKDEERQQRNHGSHWDPDTHRFVNTGITRTFTIQKVSIRMHLAVLGMSQYHRDRQGHNRKRVTFQLGSRVIRDSHPKSPEHVYDPTSSFQTHRLVLVTDDDVLFSEDIRQLY